MIRRVARAAVLSLLGLGACKLVLNCTQTQQQAAVEDARKVATEAKTKVDSYCDSRQRAIEALGEAGAP